MNMFHRDSAPCSIEDADLRRALERAGWRFTRQRAAVYKALEALVDAGLANRLAGDPGPTRYDGRGEPHYHLRCQRTGQVIDLPLPYDPQLLDKLDTRLVETLRQQGFEITGHRLELVGRFVSSADAATEAAR